MRPTIGMMRSLTIESTILPNAPPMMTPTARSITLPLRANSLNSLRMLIVYTPFQVSRVGSQHSPGASARAQLCLAITG